MGGEGGRAGGEVSFVTGCNVLTTAQGHQRCRMHIERKGRMYKSVYVGHDLRYLLRCAIERQL